MNDEPRCPRCHIWKSVVSVPNPQGGYMLKCNRCELEWLNKKPDAAKQETQP